MSNSSNTSARILIVDDEAPVRHLLAEVLGSEYDCVSVASGEPALEAVRSGEFAVVISDIDMPGMTGIDLVPRVHELDPNAVILIISGSLSIDYAVKAIRVGAYDYITKPFQLDAVERAVRRAVDHHRQLLGKKKYEKSLKKLVKQRTQELNYLIYHDSLTNLPNRALFEDRFLCAVKAARKGGYLSVFFLSLDAFDKIQDIFGHGEADKCLKEIGSRLAGLVPERSCLSRLQGSDYALMVTEDLGPDGEKILASQMGEAVKLPVQCGGTEIFLTASIGVSIWPEDGCSVEELRKNCGNALRHAREAGGDTVQFHSAGYKAKVEARVKLEAELRRALDRDEFEVHYQPKVSISTGSITGVEALVRWQHPDRGFVSPAEFIPIAEETGLIVPLGELVLRTACRDGSRWHSNGFSIDIAINISTRQLKQGDLAERFEAIVKGSGADPKLLHLEVTESSMIENAGAAVATLERLRRFGITVSLDDFGTGYSSLAHLKRLPIDQLKIDREFVSDIGSDSRQDDTVLTRAIVNLGHNLGLKVVAEGVEHKDQLQFLQSIGCDEYQGFYFSKPISALDISTLLDGEAMSSHISPKPASCPSILPQSSNKATTQLCLGL